MRGNAEEGGPSTSGRDGGGAATSGGVLPHRQYRGQRVETPSYPGVVFPSTQKQPLPGCYFPLQARLFIYSK